MEAMARCKDVGSQAEHEEAATERHEDFGQGRPECRDQPETEARSRHGTRKYTAVQLITVSDLAGDGIRESV